MKLDSLPTEAGAASVAASSRENQHPDQTSTDSTFPAGIAYNVPDGFEEDQEIIRSEMMFFNTPLTEKYSAEVYGAVQNIQDQCIVDYRTFCPTSAPFMNLNSLMAQLLIPMNDQRIFRGRRLKSSELKTGADYVGYLRSFYAPFNLHLLGNTHPLSAAVYRDPETGKFKAVESTRDRMPVPDKEIKAPKPDAQQVQVRSHVHTAPKAAEHHHHHGRRLSEEAKGSGGRKAAPGWKPPASEPSKKAIKPTNPEPQVQVQAHHATSHAHTVPKVEHHDHMHRQLRVGAPGWHQPPAPAVSGVHTVVEHPLLEKMASAEDHHNGRMAAPGWKQPVVAASEVSDKAIKPTNPDPQMMTMQGPPRALRVGAPGWHQPPLVAAATDDASAAPLVGGPAVDVMTEEMSEASEAHIEPAFLKSLDDAEEMPQGVAGPCSKPFQQGLAGLQQSSLSVAGFRPTSLFFSPGGFFFRQQQVEEGQDQQGQPQGQLQGQAVVGSDFRSFILDFLSGRDASLSLTTSSSGSSSPLTISVQHLTSNKLRASADDDTGGANDDEAVAQDDGYYYSYYDDDGANYSYDDALFLNDDDDANAVDDATAADDDDFFAQRFFLPPSGAMGERPPSLPATADAAKPVVGALKLTARPSSAVHSRLGQMAAARRENYEHKQGGASSEEDEGEDSDGSGDEMESDGSGDEKEHDGHKHEHRRSSKGLEGIKARLSSLVHGHHRHSAKHSNSKHMEKLDHHEQDHDHHDRPEKGGDRRDKDDHDHHHDHDHDHDRDDPRNGGGPRGPPNDDKRKDPDSPRGPPPPPPHHPPMPPVPEDHSFSGNLGFGADGDMCMYRAMSQGRVSQPCVGAVSELYELRAQYWEESQQPQDFHHHHGLGLLILGVVLLACTVRRIYAVRYEKKVRSLLTALHTHPHLKNSVEAETGLEVPVPVPAGTCCIGANTDGSSSGVTLAKAGKVVAFAVLIFAVSFAVSFSALEITMHVVNEMDKHAPEDPNTGEPGYTSPLAALFVLFFVCTAELTLLALLVRGVKACFKRRAETSSATSASSSPSAPFDPRGPSSRSSRLSQHAQQILASLPPALFGRSRPQQAADGYSPLLGEESQHGARGGAPVLGTEMTSVRMSAYPAQHASQQQQYVPVYVPVEGPVTASPIGAHSINMV